MSSSARRRVCRPIVSLTGVMRSSGVYSVAAVVVVVHPRMLSAPAVQHQDLWQPPAQLCLPTRGGGHGTSGHLGLPSAGVRVGLVETAACGGAGATVRQRHQGDQMTHLVAQCAMRPGLGWSGARVEEGKLGGSAVQRGGYTGAIGGLGLTRPAAAHASSHTRLFELRAPTWHAPSTSLPGR